MTSINVSAKKDLTNKKLSDYKLVAIDMDGTALNEQHQLSSYTIEVIQKVHQKGLTVLLSTGRMASAVTDHLLQLKTPGLIVAHNGALVKDILSNKQYVHKTVPYEVTADVVTIAQQSGLILHYNQDDNIQVKKPTAISKRYAKELGIHLTALNKEDTFSGDATSLLILHKKDTLESFLSYISAEHPNKFDNVLIPWSKGIWMLQILPKGTSKGDAVIQTAEQLGVKPEQIIGFGDSYNDLELVSYAGLGIAMGNACNELKVIADYITKTNQQHGVATALEELLNNE